jgi:hypothetical protein
MLKLNLSQFRNILRKKIPIYIAEQSNNDVGNFIPEFSVTGLLWSAASVICDGNFRCFLPQWIKNICCTNYTNKYAFISGQLCWGNLCDDLYIIFRIIKSANVKFWKRELSWKCNRTAYDIYGAATRSAAGKSDLPVDDKGAQLPELVDEPVRPPCPYLMVFCDRIPFCGPNMFRG